MRWAIVRRSRFALGTLALFFLTIPFCPWIWKEVPDSYFAYSGLVVEKGTEHHPFAGEGWANYIVVEDSRGVRTKKYLSDSEYALVEKGTPVVKKRGFGEFPLRSGQLTPAELSRELEKRKREAAH
jgi:hypothetical protein